MATFDEVRGTIEAANERYVEASARFATTYYNVMHAGIDDISRVDMTKVIGALNMCSDIINICNKLIQNAENQPQQPEAQEESPVIEPEIIEPE